MLRRVILDVLKPYEPNKIELCEKLSSIKGVDGVNIITYEMDRKVENVKIIVEGRGFKFEDVKNLLEDMGAAIHSVDEIAAGKKIIEDVSVPSDISATWLR